MTLAIPPGKPFPQRFTVSGSWVVPSDIFVIWVKLTGAGGGGGGGHATGGGGGGGGASPETAWIELDVTPGQTLTLTVPTAPAGGAVATNGTNGDVALLTGADLACPASGYGVGGLAGAATNGGNGGGLNYDSLNMLAFNGPTGDADGGGASSQATAAGLNALGYASTGGAGAGTSGGGGGGARSFFSKTLVAGGTNIGGGGGGCTGYGLGGVGGTTSVAGTAAAATAFGAGGGGGGQNAVGGAGAPGLIRIRYWR